MPSSIDARGATLLIVDDKPQNLRLISDFLAEHGFDLMLSRSGAQAIDKARLAGSGHIQRRAVVFVVPVLFRVC